MAQALTEPQEMQVVVSARLLLAGTVRMKKDINEQQQTHQKCASCREVWHLLNSSPCGLNIPQTFNNPPTNNCT